MASASLSTDMSAVTEGIHVYTGVRPYVQARFDVAHDSDEILICITCIQLRIYPATHHPAPKVEPYMEPEIGSISHYTVIQIMVT